jgi:hypothetical protein
MPRKNTRVERKKTPRRYQVRDANPNRNKRLAPIQIQDVVVPKGKCFVGSRFGKLKFTKDEVDKALRQAQHNRAIKGSGKVETRYYSCEDGRPGGCGFWHLTSHETYTPRPR